MRRERVCRDVGPRARRSEAPLYQYETGKFLFRYNVLVSEPSSKVPVWEWNTTFFDSPLTHSRSVALSLSLVRTGCSWGVRFRRLKFDRDKGFDDREFFRQGPYGVKPRDPSAGEIQLYKPENPLKSQRRSETSCIRRLERKILSRSSDPEDSTKSPVRLTPHPSQDGTPGHPTTYSGRGGLSKSPLLWQRPLLQRTWRKVIVEEMGGCWSGENRGEERPSPFTKEETPI